MTLREQKLYSEFSSGHNKLAYESSFVKHDLHIAFVNDSMQLGGTQHERWILRGCGIELALAATWE